MLKQPIKALIKSFGYEVRKVRPPDPAQSANLDLSAWFCQSDLIRDKELYRPLFSPWFGAGDFGKYYALAKPNTLVSADRCYILWALLRQAIHVNGDIWECGVYKGGTAAMMAAVLRDAKLSKKLFLFDTFEGMPETDAKRDWHKRGEFSDTSVEAVSNYVGCEEFCDVRKGYMPATFQGLESAKIALAHIDVDIYKSILDCLGFVWPRLSPGGFIIFDDYGFPSCPGARFAVDETCFPLCLPTGQAILFKGASI